jgi:chromosome segregation ATPase
MITLLSITVFLLTLYGVCVTYLLWAWYGEYQQLEKKCERLRWDVISHEREASVRLEKLRVANNTLQELNEELAKWQNRAGFVETKLEQVKMVVR